VSLVNIANIAVPRFACLQSSFQGVQRPLLTGGQAHDASSAFLSWLAALGSTAQRRLPDGPAAKQTF